MPMNFHDPEQRSMYTGRKADISWEQLMNEEVNVKGVQAADIGCGGGIYSQALVRLGAASVIGIDFSMAMLEAAAVQCAAHPEIRFQLGKAWETGLGDESVELILEWALIHHLSPEELSDAFQEAYRILKEDGALVVQDRTPDDCLLEGSRHHLRGYLFEMFPKLSDREVNRRYRSEQVGRALASAGFTEIRELKLWELRRAYLHFSDYCDDIRRRTGRSILHELTDEELVTLTRYIQDMTGYQDGEPVEERDLWTVWIAGKH